MSEFVASASKSLEEIMGSKMDDPQYRYAQDIISQAIGVNVPARKAEDLIPALEIDQPEVQPIKTALIAIFKKMNSERKAHELRSIIEKKKNDVDQESATIAQKLLSDRENAIEEMKQTLYKNPPEKRITENDLDTP